MGARRDGAGAQQRCQQFARQHSAPRPQDSADGLGGVRYRALAAGQEQVGTGQALAILREAFRGRDPPWVAADAFALLGLVRHRIQAVESASTEREVARVVCNGARSAAAAAQGRHAQAVESLELDHADVANRRWTLNDELAIRRIDVDLVARVAAEGEVVLDVEAQTLAGS